MPWRNACGCPAARSKRCRDFLLSSAFDFPFAVRVTSTLPLRIIFLGTAELSCASLARLAGDERFQIVAVVTQADKPKGRELKLTPPPIKVLAEKSRLRVLQPPRARDETFISELRGLKPDLLVVVAYGQILPPAILDLPPHGCLNVHASLLPELLHN